MFLHRGYFRAFLLFGVGQSGALPQAALGCLWSWWVSVVFCFDRWLMVVLLLIKLINNITLSITSIKGIAFAPLRYAWLRSSGCLGSKP